MSGVVIIINPKSGPKRRGTGAERVEIASRALQRLGVKGEIRLTERAGHAHDLALEAADARAELVMAWGGDGTINEVGRALVQRVDAGTAATTADSVLNHVALPALGIIPGGSGNGLARDLGIPFDPAGAIEHALSATSRRIDAGELGDRLFFNVAGIGLDAHVAALVTTRVHHRGLMPYLRASAADLLRYQPAEYILEMDGRTSHTSAIVLAFANSTQWGFGAHIAPGADLEDGLIDLVVVRDCGLVGNMLRVPSLFTRGIRGRRGVDSHRVREVTIRSREPMLFHVDGEAAQGSNTLIARVHPRALQLRA